MGLRTGLHDELCRILAEFCIQNRKTLGFADSLTDKEIAERAREHVYFQPKENTRILYPCIVYKRSRIDTTFACNMPYAQTKEYTVMAIDRNPDSPLPDMIAALPMCVFDRHYVTENLYHDVFTICF